MAGEDLNDFRYTTRQEAIRGRLERFSVRMTDWSVILLGWEERCIMKTITRDITTELIMLAVVLGVLSCTEAPAGDRWVYGEEDDDDLLHVRRSQPSIYGGGIDRILHGWDIDRTFISRRDARDVLQVTVTKARWNGRNYVAYLLVEWGNLDGVVGNVPEGVWNDWNGSVTVDDGGVFVVEAIGFDAAGPAGEPQLTLSQSRKIAEYRQDLEDKLAKAERQRDKEIANARKGNRNGTKLRKELEKIDKKYAEQVAGAREDYRSKTAKILAKAERVAPADSIVATDDYDEVKWVAGVGGGVDGVLLKLVLDDAESEVVVRAGGEKIKFTTSPQRTATVQYAAPQVRYYVSTPPAPVRRLERQVRLRRAPGRVHGAEGERPHRYDRGHSAAVPGGMIHGGSGITIRAGINMSSSGRRRGQIVITKR